MYHKVDKMKCMGVLKNEIELMDYIIEFNKTKEIDFDDFESKKDMLDVAIGVFTLNYKLENRSTSNSRFIRC